MAPQNDPPPTPTSQPTDTTTTTPPVLAQKEKQNAPERERNPVLHTAALAMAILGPIAILLPSRGGAAKSTLQNAVLGSAAFWGVNQLAEEYTGKSITARSGERWGAMLGIKSQSQSGDGGEGAGVGGGGKEGEGDGKKTKVGGVFDLLPTETAARNKELMAAERRRRAEAEGREYKEPRGQTLFERLWMGKESEGWQEKRLEEERKALESGKGYGGLIADQVREVFGKGAEGKREGEEGEGKRDEGEGKRKGE